MPLENDGTTDGLIKSLQIELYQVVDGAELGKWGWRDFRNIDHPKTTDPVEMAMAAFIQLAIDDDKKWRQNYEVTAGVLSFLQARRQASPTIEQLDDLITALEFPEVSIEDVKAWFREVFPPLPK